MIAGLFLSNYKSYKNINFIPLVDKREDMINVFVGHNGAGKSSVLESIGMIMNNVPSKLWQTTLGQKKDRTSIFPVFLIKKDEFRPTAEELSISQAFWNTGTLNLTSNDAAREFKDWVNEISQSFDPEKYLLYAIGKNYAGATLLTTTFDKAISNKTKRSGVSKNVINALFDKILSRYDYIYVPVENKISDILSLQAREMQGLMDKSVVDEIKSILDKKEHSVEHVGGKKKEVSLVDLVNKKLDEYMVGINQDLSNGYAFNAGGAHKKTVKSTDILSSILDSYFKVRPLTKDGKHITSLSSGEQRKALIDVATTLLSTDKQKSKEVIIAIDEPESSLEVASQFEQFLRIVDIAERYNRQVFITTHWYGLLLRPVDGRLNFVEEDSKTPNVISFPLNGLYEHRGDFPESVEMKSYFDLISSMLSLLKASEHKWLFCEGSIDAKYIETHLQKLKSRRDIFILPFKGCGNIKRLYDFLSVPMGDKKEKSGLKGKVGLLIDTDAKNIVRIEGYSHKSFSGSLQFNRLGLDRDTGMTNLNPVSSVVAVNTEIEDVLCAKTMWKALEKVAQVDVKLSNLLTGIEYNDDIFISDLTGKAEFLKRTSLEAHNNFAALQAYLHTGSVKKLICDSYCDTLMSEDDIPELNWVNQLDEFFS